MEASRDDRSSDSCRINLDSKLDIPILVTVPDRLSQYIKTSRQEYEVVGYKGEEEKQDILMHGTYSSVYDLPTGGITILICNNGLGG